MKNRDNGASTFHLILEDILLLVDSFDVVSWSFVRRSDNKVAHLLAHLSPSEVGERVWDQDFPLDVVYFARCDLVI